MPNLSDNVAVGKSNNKALASTGGANTVTSTGNVGGSTANATLSTDQLSSHSHGLNLPAGGDGANNAVLLGTGIGQQSRNFNTNTSGSGQGHSHNMSANFSGDATSVIQPYLTVIYIIKT